MTPDELFLARKISSKKKHNGNNIKIGEFKNLIESQGRPTIATLSCKKCLHLKEHIMEKRKKHIVKKQIIYLRLSEIETKYFTWNEIFSVSEV